ncbi:MAG TPA: NfeD family protein [Candidatus Limnocylindrales bacterium]|jgi:membrane-bound serine protease (ClpP class)
MDQLVAFLSDPNIAFVLFVIGALGIAIEAVHSNLVTGVLGGFALILAFIGFGSLPLNVAALVLLAFAFVLFVAETQFTSHGLLTAAAIVALALGASFLYTDTPTSSGVVVHVDPALIIVTTGTVALLMAGVSYAAIRTRRMRAPLGIVGTPPIVGTLGIVHAPLEPVGSVQLGGETWSARTPNGLPLDRDTPVRLVGFDGLTAIVEPSEGAASMAVHAPAVPLSADHP